MSISRAPLLIVYTSGTTGRPKGAVLRQEALVWNAVMSQHMHDMTAADHVLTVLPLFHVGGLNIQTTPALQLGATVTLHPRFAPDATLDAIARDRPTLTVLVPATMQAVIEHPRWDATDIDLPARAHHRLDAGAAGPGRCLHGARRAGAAGLRLDRDLPDRGLHARRTAISAPGSTGLPGLVCEARVVDDAGDEVAPGVAGEVVVRGPNVFFEYWGNAAATAEALRDGWYHSGDIGTRDADGHFFIHDRKKNMIISGGENIYPAEVERVLIAHPDVAEGAVIGRADPKWQEVPVAYVVRRPDATCDARALEAHLLGAARALQGAARIRVRRRAAAQRDGQGAAFRAARTGSRLMRIAVLGGGNGSFAAAGDFALAGHDVRLWRRDAEAVKAHNAAGGVITVKDFRGRHEAKLSLVTNDIADGGARCRTDPLPRARDRAARHRARARAASRDGQVVFLPPGTFGSYIFAKATRDAGNRADAAFAETGTLPWLTRKHGPHEVAITIRAKRLPTGVLPLRLKDHALDVIGRAFPGVIEDCGDALSGALMNAGPIIHPPLITMNAAPLEHFPRWDIHKEGTQPAVRRVTDALDAERIAVREALGYGAPHFPLADHYAREGEEWMYGRGSHDKLTDSRRLARAHRADAASLHAGGCADRTVVPRLVRRTCRRADAARARISVDRRRDLR